VRLEGKHTLYTYARVPSEPDVSDEEIAERAEARIEAFAPGFRDLILARSLRGPARLERDNPSLVGGDLGGGTFELDEQLIFRPAPELVRYRTPLRGLYVGSTSVHPVVGVHGACGAAGAVLADGSKLRFWR
jgi:phytoene dehydrogenase-like protein